VADVCFLVTLLNRQLSASDVQKRPRKPAQRNDPVT